MDSTNNEDKSSAFELSLEESENESYSSFDEIVNESMNDMVQTKDRSEKQ